VGRWFYRHKMSVSTTPRKNICACTKLWKYGGEFEYQFLKQKHAN
jgi:hypothetical protein